jgi:DNA-binding NtrC family response regulator
VQKTVLVVEDEFLVALDLSMVLERGGWHVLGPAATTAEALRLLDDERPVVALLDVALKEGTVTLVAEALRARNVPFVVASAYGRPELVGGEVLAGAPKVGKPTNERRLLELLERFVEP